MKIYIVSASVALLWIAYSANAISASQVKERELKEDKSTNKGWCCSWIDENGSVTCRDYRPCETDADCSDLEELYHNMCAQECDGAIAEPLFSMSYPYRMEEATEEDYYSSSGENLKYCSWTDENRFVACQVYRPCKIDNDCSGPEELNYNKCMGTCNGAVAEYGGKIVVSMSSSKFPVDPVVGQGDFKYCGASEEDGSVNCVTYNTCETDEDCDYQPYYKKCMDTCTSLIYSTVETKVDATDAGHGGKYCGWTDEYDFSVICTEYASCEIDEDCSIFFYNHTCTGACYYMISEHIWDDSAVSKPLKYCGVSNGTGFATCEINYVCEADEDCSGNPDIPSYNECMNVCDRYDFGATNSPSPSPSPSGPKNDDEVISVASSMFLVDPVVGQGEFKYCGASEEDGSVNCVTYNTCKSDVDCDYQPYYKKCLDTCSALIYSTVQSKVDPADAGRGDKYCSSLDDGDGSATCIEYAQCETDEDCNNPEGFSFNHTCTDACDNKISEYIWNTSAVAERCPSPAQNARSQDNATIVFTKLERDSSSAFSFIASAGKMNAVVAFSIFAVFVV